MDKFWTAPSMEPSVVTETPSYLVLYKPPRMHTVPIQPEEEHTLLAWTAIRFPEVLRIKGRKAVEGGFIHRLDYETHGLVLCARTEDAFLVLSEQQRSGTIIKKYEACCYKEKNTLLSGFPPLPADFTMPQCATGCVCECECVPTVIESAFRPFGKGRKAVRPLLEGNAKYKMGDIYRTEILSCGDMGNVCFLKIRIKKGFRHQIRCHLAWIGLPIVNDPLYASGSCEPAAPGVLALRATGITVEDGHSIFL